MRRAERTMRAMVALGGLGFALGVVGCGGEARRAQLRSANPLDRAEAIVKVAEGGDLRAVHKLVDLLDDDDSAVRMYANLALRRLCGEDFGYRYFDDIGTRSVAIRRWRERLRAGTVQIHATTRPSAAADEGVATPGAEGAGAAAGVTIAPEAR